MKKILVLKIAVIIFTFGLFGCGVIKTQQKESAQTSIGKKKELSAEQQTKSLQHYINGSEKESKGDISGAIIEYLDALRLDDNHAIYFALAKNYEALSKFDLAKEMLQNAIKKDSTKTEYYSLLAKVYIQLSENNSAIIQLQNIIRIDPDNVDAMYTIAKITEQSKPLVAIDMYKRIIEKTGSVWEVYMELGKLYISQKKFEEAAEIYEKMLSIDTKNKSLKQTIVDMYIRAEKYDKAITHLKKLIILYPDEVDAQAALVDVYLKQNKWDEAVPYLQKIIESDSVSIEYRFRAAFVYFTKAQEDISIMPITKKYLTTLSIKEPKDWRAIFYLGIIYASEKNDSLAMQMFEKVTTLATWNSDAWSYLGSIYFDRKEYEPMVNILNKAITYVPKDFRLHYLLGIAYSQLKKNNLAINSYEKARELNPKDLNILSALGLEYDNLKQFTKSDSAYEQVLMLNPENITVLNNYAYSLSERGKYLQKALSMSKQSLQKDSTNSSFLDTIGWIYFKLGDYDLAEFYIQKSISNGETNAVVFEHLGDVYAKKKELEKAKMWWSKALELDKANILLKEKISRGGL